MRYKKIIFAVSLAIMSVAPAVRADFLDRLQNTIEHAVESETNRKADEVTRKAMRCLYGDTECFEKADRAGRKVIIVYDKDPKPAHGR